MIPGFKRQFIYIYIYMRLYELTYIRTYVTYVQVNRPRSVVRLRKRWNNLLGFLREKYIFRTKLGWKLSQFHIYGGGGFWYQRY